jgi:integrase
MPTKKLTDLFVERVRPPARGRRIEYFDAAFGGLALRVTDTGHKSWCLYYRINGRQRRLTIDSWPRIKTKAARVAAGAALERLREGFDPAEEKRQRRDERASEADTFSIAVSDYLARARPNLAPGTFKEVKRVLEREFASAWQNRPLASITRGDVNLIIDRIVARGAGIQANRAFAYLRAMLNWTVERGRLPVSPIAGKPPTRERPRDRVLNNDEVRWLWHACDEIEWPFGPLVKLMLLTAQRRDEVASLEWSELDLKKRLWTMPREKAKNDRAHEVQLSDLALDLLNSIPRIGHGLVFTSTGTTPVSGFSRAKRRLDAAMVAAKHEELGAKCEPIAKWTLHDLRRTAATGIARLNFPPHVIDRLLNHLSGTIRGMAAVYNRFEYIDDRRAALEAWGRHINNLIAPAPVNVVALRS